MTTIGKLIEAIEERGQQAIIDTPVLPRDMRPDQATFEAMGFTFSEIPEIRPEFIGAVLPEGWTKVASDSILWSYIVDAEGVRRVAVFFKAAPYDFRAWMRLAVDNGEGTLV